MLDREKGQGLEGYVQQGKGKLQQEWMGNRDIRRYKERESEFKRKINKKGLGRAKTIRRK